MYIVTPCTCAKGKVIGSVVVIVPENRQNSRVVIVVKISEIPNSKYLCQGFPKGIALKLYFLLVTPISHTHSNYLHIHVL